VADGGTGASTAAGGFDNLKQAATETYTGVVELATNAEVATGTDTTRAVTPAGVASVLHSAVTLAGTPDYITLSGQQITRGLIDLTTDITGNLPVGHLGSGTNASSSTYLRGDMTWQTVTGGLAEATSTQVRTGTAGVAISPSVRNAANAPVTLTDAATVAIDMNAGLVFQLTLGGNRTMGQPTNQKVGQSGQFVILQDGTGGRTLAWHADFKFSGGTPVIPPAANAWCVVAYYIRAANDIVCATSVDTSRLLTVTESGTSRTNTSADAGNWVRWTSTSAKTFTIANSVASAGDVWSGINAAASGTLTLVAGSGVTLTGALAFASLKSYSIRFVSASAADVVGGA
jgi:hypothetical protein